MLSVVEASLTSNKLRMTKVFLNHEVHEDFLFTAENTEGAEFFLCLAVLVPRAGYALEASHKSLSSKDSIPFSPFFVSFISPALDCPCV